MSVTGLCYMKKEKKKKSYQLDFDILSTTNGHAGTKKRKQREERKRREGVHFKDLEMGRERVGWRRREGGGGGWRRRMGGGGGRDSIDMQIVSI